MGTFSSGNIKTLPTMPSVEAGNKIFPCYFPEQWFPCVPDKNQDFKLRVQLGNANMAASTVAICGLARSLGAVAPLTIARIKKIVSYFRDYCVIIFENDSEDDTLTILRDWEKSDNKVIILSQKLWAPRYPQTRCLERAAAMAGYRNHYLELLREHHLKPDYTIVLDTDLEGGISYDGLASTFGHLEWDVVGSNGLFVWKGIKDGVPRIGLVHFDAWAYRAYGQTEPHPAGPVNKYVYRRGESMVPVFSAFGGMAAYRTKALISAKYSGEDCEHVPLHIQIRRAGYGKIYLNPSQIALYSPIDEISQLRNNQLADPRISLDI